MVSDPGNISASVSLKKFGISGILNYDKQCPARMDVQFILDPAECHI